MIYSEGEEHNITARDKRRGLKRNKALLSFAEGIMVGGDSSAIKPSYNGVLPVKPKQEPPCEEKPPARDDCYKTFKCWKIVVWVLAAMIFLLFILVLILLLRR